MKQILKFLFLIFIIITHCWITTPRNKKSLWVIRSTYKGKTGYKPANTFMTMDVNQFSPGNGQIPKFLCIHMRACTHMGTRVCVCVCMWCGCAYTRVMLKKEQYDKNLLTLCDQDKNSGSHELHLRASWGTQKPVSRKKKKNCVKDVNDQIIHSLIKWAKGVHEF